MKTILKFVAYLEIDSENLDRKLLTNSVQALLFPKVTELLAVRHGVDPDVIEKVSKNCMGRIHSMKFIHTQNLFKPLVKEVVVNKDIKSEKKQWHPMDELKVRYRDSY